MNLKMVLIAAFLLTLPSLKAGTSEPKPFEMPRTQVIPIQETESGRQYELYIKLPEGYSEKNDIKYPVLYFTDAVWHIEILSAATEYLFKDLILVGISWQKYLNMEIGQHASRFRDYSIKKSTNSEYQKKYHFGQANHHLKFIRNDVIEYMEGNYRTDTDNRTYFGYSLGGLFGAYVLLVQPDTFKNYILGSPSLKGNVADLFKLEPDESLSRKNLDHNVFLTVGELEEDQFEPIEKFKAILKNRNNRNLILKHVVIEAADHGRAFPATGVRSVTWLSKFPGERQK